MTLKVFGSRVLKYWVLGPSGLGRHLTPYQEPWNSAAGFTMAISVGPKSEDIDRYSDHPGQKTPDRLPAAQKEDSTVKLVDSAAAHNSGALCQATAQGSQALQSQQGLYRKAKNQEPVQAQDIHKPKDLILFPGLTRLVPGPPKYLK